MPTAARPAGEPTMDGESPESGEAGRAAAAARRARGPGAGAGGISLASIWAHEAGTLVFSQWSCSCAP